MKNIILTLFLIFCLSISLNAKWEITSFTPYTSLNDICSLDSNTFYVTGFTETPAKKELFIRKTTDYGNSWETIFSIIAGTEYKNLPCQRLKLFALDKNTIFAVAKGRHFYKTYDGGVTWDSLRLDVPHSVLDDDAFTDMHFFDKNEGIITYGLIDSLIYTKDAGKTLEYRSFPYPELLYFPYQISIFNKNLILVSIYRMESTWKYIAKTTDLGLTWDWIPDSNNICLNYVFKNENEIWSSGFLNPTSGTAVIKKSVDVGKNWEIVYDGSNIKDDYGEFLNLNFLDDSTLVTYSNNYEYLSKDYGKTWSRDCFTDDNKETKGNWLFDVEVGSKNHRMVICFGNYVLKYNSLTGIEDKDDVASLKAYPNPMNNQTINLSISCKESLNGLIKIYDENARLIDSKEIFLKKGSNEISINTENNLQPGTYYIFIESDGGIIAKEKFVKM
ncbi:MAG: T9SS type A sorting domain-containing protein [bacterium]